ncbi:phosphocholine cytidylyltransferase family protein [Aurantiacibacter poecillastricola]|uniref:phosphocholine cytidylyltransferase family protein n=1 Tax=Aurantiacibacter poecillastricola TaxID=3064385 RepID=UPI00273F3609|nr:NTP transferase domain-containing protein [Aurantiacibacter sp. 219JJ12-13]MDP5261362.1 NTP transferase domain-containing protein [Aurantiacibacter sp. 219JJ12-13]
MDALVLAAGLGSRLSDISGCKPLTPLAGMPLLEIAIRQLAAVGAARVIVATGYKAGEVEAALPRMARSAGIVVEARRVEDFRQPNGYSVIAGARAIEGDFMLVMADHVFSSGVLNRLATAPLPSQGVLLATDRRTRSPLVDPEDATWVRTGESGAITAIGKTIDFYDAVDCGAFRATQALPAAIERAIAQGRPGSLSDGMQVLADSGQAFTVDIGEDWWIDVDDARALDLAERDVAQFLPEIFTSQRQRAAR